MLSVEKNNPILQSFIGKKVTHFASKRLDFSHNEIRYYDMRVNISLFQGPEIQIITSSFFESDGGEMFHDYTIEIAKAGAYEETQSKFSIDSDPIDKIEVYGRKLHWEDFDAYPKIKAKYGDTVQVDNVFVFFVKGYQSFTIAFNDFMPQIVIYLGSDSKERCFRSCQQKHDLHHVISGSSGIQ